MTLLQGTIASQFSVHINYKLNDMALKNGIQISSLINIAEELPDCTENPFGADSHLIRT